MSEGRARDPGSLGDVRATGPVRESDRRSLLRVGAATVAGLAALVAGLWGLSLVPTNALPVWLYVVPVAAVIAGLIFFGFGAGELIHRFRAGPQEPGRHTRADER